MRTYINRPDHNILTAEGLRCLGEDSLCRSLSIGRVIGFIGSGLSMEYGRPSWDTLFNYYIEFAVDSFIDKYLKSTRMDKKLEKTWEEFSSFFKSESMEELINFFKKEEVSQCKMLEKAFLIQKLDKTIKERKFNLKLSEKEKIIKIAKK
ncbi:MAG: hypothetical protein R3E95_16170 [Thiolinea sp.]